MNHEKLLTPKVVVLCTNANGDPSFHTCTPSVTQAGLDEGEHYELAKENARDTGYEGPMLAFDSMDEAAHQLGDIVKWLSEDDLREEASAGATVEG